MAGRRGWLAVGVAATLLIAGGAATATVLGRDDDAAHDAGATPTEAVTDPADPADPTDPADASTGPIAPTQHVDVDAARVLDHLEALQAVADANGGNRATGEAGFQASADYVLGVLTAAGYSPELYGLELPAMRDRSELTLLAPTERAYAPGTEFAGATMGADGRTEASGAIVPVDLGLDGPDRPTSGCEEADFDGVPEASVVLLRRGTCPVTVKALNAQAAGAVGVVLMNEGTTGRTGAFMPQGTVAGLTIPVVGTAYDVGVDLASTVGARIRLVQEIDRTPVVATSIVVQTAGDPDDVVMVGAHLDGAPDGPGMNDNASGSAAILALAEQLAGTDTGATIRFAWWTGEELGLLGSDAYVAELSPAERDRIVAYLNVDMIASPNARFEVYDGDGSGPPAWVPVPSGSAEIEWVFQGVLAARGEAYEDSELDGASDYVAFATAGIPVGGLFTGASGAKSDADAKRYGGLPDVDYDLCYHQACDSLTPPETPPAYEELGAGTELIGNINLRALDVMADTLATAAVEIAANPGLITGAADVDGA